MNHLIVLATLLLAVAGTRPAEAGIHFYNHCYNLGYSAYNKPGVAEDPKLMLSLAVQNIDPERTLMAKSADSDLSLKSLRLALKTVQKRKCDNWSLDHVVILSKCMAINGKAFTDLDEPIEQYASKCLTPAYLARKIASVDWSFFWTGPENFMDNSFMKDYRKGNAEEPKVRISPVWGDKCCRPERAALAFINAIRKRKGERVLKNRALLVEYIEDRLNEPCKRYHSEAEQLMQNLVEASEFYRGGERAMIDSLPQDSQHSIFRYKMCEELRYKSSREKLLKDIADKLDS